MRKGFWSWLLVAVVALSSLPFAGVARAETEKQQVKLVSFSVQPNVAAGSAITFTANAYPDTNIGLCCGSVTLKGPGEREFSVRLTRTTGTTLQGTLSTSPNMPTGVWEVASLSLIDNDGDSVRYTSGSNGFKHQVTVTSSGKPVDTKGPELVTLTAPAEVQTGDAAVFTATAKDDLSGVASIIVTVEAAEPTPAFTYAVELFPTAKAGEYSGSMIMDGLSLPHEKQRISRVVLRDVAGNKTTLESADLAKDKALKLETTAKRRKVPEGLITSPYLNLLHQGELTYYNWLFRDREHAQDLLKLIKSDAALAREQIAAEVPQIAAAIDSLRKELYVDPTTQLKVSPVATSAKWLALDTAMDVRMELLTELDRRAGRTRDSRKELTSATVTAIYDRLEEGEFWAPLDRDTNARLAEYPASILSVLALSPEAVKVLRTPANESDSYGPLDTMERDALYFLPIISQSGPSLEWGSARINLRLTNRTLTDIVKDLFYEIGMHFGQAVFSELGDANALARWSPYLQIRGNQTWTGNEGWLGSPMNNIGDDFAYIYLPLGLGQQYYSQQSYPRLRENKQMADAFKKLVTERLQKTAPVTALTPNSFVHVGVTPTFTATISPSTAAVRGVAEGIRYLKPQVLNRNMAPNTANGNVTYTSNDTEPGNFTWFFLTAKDTDQRTYYRYVNYFHAPIMLTPMPVATNKPSLKVSGTTAPGAAVSLAGKTATADGQGKFSFTLTLKEGANDLKVTAAGAQVGAAFTVWYEKDREVPVKVKLAGASTSTAVSGTVETEPYAIVTVGSQRTQADSKGNAYIVPELKEGVNRVEVTVTNVFGHKGSWTGSVVVDSTPPPLTVSVPKLTNQPVFKLTGTSEPGAVVMLGESVLKVDAQGKFTAEVALTAGTPRKLELTATDSAGNRATHSAEIAYSKAVPTLTREAKVTLAGAVTPGTAVTYNGKPVELLSTGGFSFEVASPAGQNVYVLNLADKDGKPAGFIQYIVVNPLQVNPAKSVGAGQVTISGKTVPGYLVLVDGQTATVDTNGEWSVTVESKGRRKLEVIVEGGGELVKESVTLP
ncbi:MAG TPA: hypothetical protein VNT75_10025 [Symbiobacteriaceae bacterium]|nr:hypothetical protein [Symbiobacteriaceae bacterium]